MDVSAQLVLLTTPDVPALKNLRVTLDMLDLLSYPRQIRSVVLNRSDSKVGLSLEHVERVVRCPIAAQIPSSRAVPVSINKGTPDHPGQPGPPGEPGHRQVRAAAAAGRAGGRLGGRQARSRGKRRVGMSLSDRLVPAAGGGRAAAGTAAVPPRRATRHADPFGPLKRSVHESLLEALGPKLYDAHLDQRELEQRVTQTLQAVLQRDETPMTTADRVAGRPGGRGRDPRPRAAGAVPARPGRLRDHGQRLTTRSTSSATACSTRSRRPSPTRATCAAPSTRSWPGSAGASTSPARWWTPGCPTAAGSTPSCRRSRSTARC